MSGRCLRRSRSPKKRLAAFERVELSPGESRRVTLTVPEKKYASFCERTLGERVVKGIYPVYVGASVSDNPPARHSFP